jgi:beta-lactamase class C
MEIEVEVRSMVRVFFRIGSLSKGFSGILVAMLADKGLLNLNDPVAKYIPQLTLNSSVPGDSLRLWHILAHTTGLTEHAFSNLIEMGKSKQTFDQGPK